MSFKQFDTDLKADQFSGICLLYGIEGYLVKWAKEALTSKFIQNEFEAFDLTKIDAQSEFDASSLLRSCETLPVMSDRRVVIVDNFKVFAGASGLDEKEEKALIDYFDKIPDTCLLIFAAGEKMDKRKKIYKKIADCGKIYEFGKLEVPDLTRWIGKQCRAYKKNIGSREAQQIIESAGYYDKDSEYGLFNLENDIRKIAMHAQGENITAEDIDGIVAGNVEKDVFAMIDALSRKDKNYALAMLEHLLAAGESVYGVLALMFRQYENLLRISEMKDDRVPNAQIRQQLGLPEFVVKKLVGYLEKYSTQTLKIILKEAYQVDKSIKTGLMEPRLAMEMFIGKVG